MHRFERGASHHRSFRHGPHGPPWRGPPLRARHDAHCGVPPRYRLQRRLFLWFGATILFTGLVVGPIVGVLGAGGAHSPVRLLLTLLAAAIPLWAASAAIAWRLTRPLAELVRVTQAIGGGDLAARVRLGRHQAGEVGALADSVNEMAARIERQLREERALLAAVSHELRSPLARLRVLVELARGGGAERLDEIDREIVEIDALIGKLLASSRLEFGELRLEALTARQVAARALEVAGVEPGKLDDASDGALVDVDPTLVGRALGNLLENAARHGGGVARLALNVASNGGRPPRVSFEVIDEGPGFEKDALEHAFEAFYSSRTSETAKGSGSLGLGLALVARIARAHAGRAYAENRGDGGARAVLELPARHGA